MKNFRSLFLLILMLSLFCLGSCTKSYEKENYSLCLTKLEFDRKKTREQGGYSYNARTYDECRSPARYGNLKD